MAQNLGRYTMELRSRAGTIERGNVTVYNAGTTDLASLYATEAGTGAIGNPVATDVHGRISFCAAPGLYDLSLPDGRVIEDVGVDSVTADEVIATWMLASDVSTGAQPFKVPIVAPYTVTGVYLTVGTAPATTAILVDIEKNGTTIFTEQDNRPTIAAAGVEGGPGEAPDVTALVVGDYLTYSIDQIGTGTVGADLVVVVVGRRA
jgi:hypothetical protein